MDPEELMPERGVGNGVVGHSAGAEQRREKGRIGGRPQRDERPPQESRPDEYYFFFPPVGARRICTPPPPPKLTTERPPVRAFSCPAISFSCSSLR